MGWTLGCLPPLLSLTFRPASSAILSSDDGLRQVDGGVGTERALGKETGGLGSGDLERNEEKGTWQRVGKLWQQVELQGESTSVLLTDSPPSSW